MGQGHARRRGECGGRKSGEGGVPGRRCGRPESLTCACGSGGRGLGLTLRPSPGEGFADLAQWPDGGSRVLGEGVQERITGKAPGTVGSGQLFRGKQTEGSRQRPWLEDMGAPWSRTPSWLL